MNSHSSREVTQLDQDMNRLDVNLTAILKEIDKLLFDLKVIENELNIPSKVNTDLKKLTGSMDDVTKLLEIVSVIPSVSSQAKDAIEAINVIEKPIKHAENAIDKFDKKIKPVKEAVEEAEAVLIDFKEKLQKMQGKLDGLVNEVDLCQNCVDSLPGSNTSLKADLNSAAETADSIIANTNNAIEVTKDLMIDVMNSFNEFVMPPFQAIYNVGQLIEDFQRVIDKLEDELGKLIACLKKKLHVSFPYVCGFDFLKGEKICHYNISFSVNDVYKGAKYIEHQIEKMLSKVLYAAAKLFGLEKLYENLKRQADEAADMLAKKIEDKLESMVFEILGLSDLEAKLDQLLTELKPFNPFKKIDFENIKNFVSEMDDSLVQVENIYKQCKKAL